MCRLIKTSLAKTVTGYKVAIKRDGKYYSPAMGTEYKVGDVEIALEQNNLTSWFHDDILDSPSYSQSMVGRTCVFTCIADAKTLLNCIDAFYVDGTPCILKMTISKDLMYGRYGHQPVFGGMHIDEMHEVTT